MKAELVAAVAYDGTGVEVLKLSEGGDGAAWHVEALPYDTQKPAVVSVWAKADAEMGLWIEAFGSGFREAVGPDWRRLILAVETPVGQAIDIMPLGSGNVYLYKCMAEAWATRASDWRAAPEDLEEEFGNLEGRVTETETELTITKNSIKAAVREAVATETADLESWRREATIQLQPGSIVSTVRTSESYLSDLNGKADASELTNLTERVREAEQKITDDAIVSTVRSILRVGGTNLLAQGNIINTYVRADNGELSNPSASPATASSGGNTCTKEMLPVEGGAAYTLSLYDTRTEASGPMGRVVAYDSAGSFLGVVLSGINWATPQSATMTMPSAAAYARVSVVGFPKYKWKFEKGNMATDWSPAPEDAEEEITALTERVHTAEQRITDSAIVNTVRSSESYQTDLSGKANASDLTALTDRVDEAELKITDSAIVSTVLSSQSYLSDLGGKADASSVTTLSEDLSEVKQTATSITARVNSLSVGGTNLLAQGNMIATYITANGALADASAGLSDRENAGDACTRDMIPVTPNTAYTLTLYDSRPDAVSTTFGRVAVFDSAGSFMEMLADELYWTTPQSRTMTMPVGAAYVRVGVPAFPRYRWKFEKGNLATDWSEAEAELHAGTTVEITKDRFRIETEVFDVNIASGSGDYLKLDENGGHMSRLTAPNVAARYDGGTAIEVSGSLAPVLAELSNKLVDQNVTILLTGDVYGDAAIAGIYGGGQITIRGGNTQYTMYGRLGLWNCAAPVVVDNVKFVKKGGDAACYQQGGMAQYINCTFNAEGDWAIYFGMGARAYMSGCALYNASNLIHLNYGCDISMESLKGGNCTNWLANNTGVAHIYNTRPDGSYWALTAGSLCVPADPQTITVDSGSAQPTTPTITEDTFTANNSGGASGSSWRSGNDIRQGIYESRNYAGCMWFDLSSFAGRTVQSATLKLYRTASGSGGMADVTLWWTPRTGKSGNPRTDAVSYGKLGAIAGGNSKTFNVPAAAVQKLINSGGGLMLDPGDTEKLSGKDYSKSYTRFAGAGDANAPVLTVNVI